MTRPIIIGATFCAVLGVALISAWMGSTYDSSADIPPLQGKAPEFALTNQFNQPFGTEQLRGKAYVLNFFFASCGGPCPVMSAEISSIASNLVKNNNVHFVSVSVDPEADTPEVLKDYAEKFGGLRNWSFLTGDFKDIAKIGEELKVDSDGEPQSHNTKLFLIDQNNFVRGQYSSFDFSARQQLLKSIRAITRNH